MTQAEGPPASAGGLTVLDPRAGQEARDDGMARAEAGAGSQWVDRAVARIREVALSQPRLTADDVWAEGLGHPHEARALGPCFKRAEAMGIVEPTAEFVLTAQVKRHRAPVRVWRSLVFRGPAVPAAAAAVECGVVNMSALDADLAVIAADPPDVMIVDPPYAAHVHKKAVSQSLARGVRSRDLGFEHLSVALRRRIARLAALTRRWSVIYTDVESLTWWRLSLQAAGATYVRSIPWVRWSAPQLSGDRPVTGCEMVVVAYGSSKGKKHWNGPGNLLSLTHTCLRGEDKHKTEKPLDQLLDLVSYFSDPGECVLDPCAGSGTTGLACRILGRQFVGLEIDAHWTARANERLSSGLNERDLTRLERWEASQQAAEADRARVDEHTASVRAKADAARGET